ncbi:MAG: hypothetical protein ACYCUD_11865 [Candidatus Dormibacteria bacterium]
MIAPPVDLARSIVDPGGGRLRLCGFAQTVGQEDELAASAACSQGGLPDAALELGCR